MNSVVNFRDIGGFPTQQGTEWGSFNNFLGGALFPVGLIALTFVGGELATGNMMVMTLGVLQKKVRVGALCYNWIVVLLTNCLGGFLVADFINR